MSEIYLTKIERKTIFTKSLIFVLIMFIISDLTVTGPFYFNFIPWMFILGLVGSIKKIDSVLMSVIATFTVFIASIIFHGGVNTTCILSTFITLVTLIFGIITGKFMYEFILQRRLVKYIVRSKKIVYIALSIVMLISSWIMVSINSGNIVTYLKSRENLKEYIQTVYNVEEFSVVKAQYIKSVPGKYIYTLQIEEQNVCFVPIAKDIFRDVTKDDRLANLQQNLDYETKDRVKQILNKYSMMKNATAEFKLEYGDVCIIPNITSINITYGTSSDDEENIDVLYDELVAVIKELQNIKGVQKIVITIGESTLQISGTNVQNLTADYIRGGFDIQEIIE